LQVDRTDISFAAHDAYQLQQLGHADSAAPNQAQRPRIRVRLEYLIVRADNHASSRQYHEHVDDAGWDHGLGDFEGGTRLCSSGAQYTSAERRSRGR
jgi:hypothetical protein